MREELSTITQQVPLLGSLPGVGFLFRHKSEETVKKEIIVLITPHIVCEPDACCEGDKAAAEFHRRQAVYADQMSPLGKRYLGRKYYRLAQAAWAHGDQKTALRFIDLAVHFDPESRAAINLRTDIWNGNLTGDHTLVHPSLLPPASFSVGGDDVLDQPSILSPGSGIPSAVPETLPPGRPSPMGLESKWRAPPTPSSTNQAVVSTRREPGRRAERRARWRAFAGLGRGWIAQVAGSRRTDTCSRRNSNNVQVKSANHRMQSKIHTSSSLLLIMAIALLASGCASMNTIRQAIARNSADDVGPSRESRSVALAREFDRRRDDAQFQAAASAWQRGDLDGCHKLIDQLLERNPADRRSRLMLADVLLFSGQTAQAADELSKLVADDPKDAVAQHAFAEVLDASGRQAEAIAHHEEAARLEPNRELYAQCVKAARDAGATQDRSIGQSSQPTQSARSIDTQDSGTPLERAAAALAANDAQQAIDAATQGLKESPDQAEPLYRVLGTAYYRRGDYAAAQSALAQALSLDKSDALAYFLQGHVLDKLGQTDAAARSFAEAARLDARFSL